MGLPGDWGGREWKKREDPGISSSLSVQSALDHFKRELEDFSRLSLCWFPTSHFWVSDTFSGHRTLEGNNQKLAISSAFV
jgi:hypothetical protein